MDAEYARLSNQSGCASEHASNPGDQRVFVNNPDDIWRAQLECRTSVDDGDVRVAAEVAAGRLDPAHAKPYRVVEEVRALEGAA